MTRPLIDHGIKTLEAEFTRRSDPDFLRTLLDELEYRSTDRATRLKVLVESCISTAESIAGASREPTPSGDPEKIEDIDTVSTLDDPEEGPEASTTDPEPEAPSAILREMPPSPTSPRPSWRRGARWRFSPSPHSAKKAISPAETALPSPSLIATSCPGAGPAAVAATTSSTTRLYRARSNSMRLSEL
jgi:hypothetical protein